MNVDFRADFGLGGDVGFDKCSRAGCIQQATTQLLWNNPKIHDEERTKIWLSCDEHREYLSKFLTLRGFLRSVDSLN